MIDVHSVASAAEDQTNPETRQQLLDDLNIVHDGSEMMHCDERHGEEVGLITNIPLDHPMQDGPDLPAEARENELENDTRDAPSGVESHSSCVALISSGSATVTEQSDAHAGSAAASADVEMNGVDAAGVEDSALPASIGDGRNGGVPQEASLIEQANTNNGLQAQMKLTLLSWKHFQRISVRKCWLHSKLHSKTTPLKLQHILHQGQRRLILSF
uniref:Uncharacterized protein n=1 Tax=Ananas comosus var. bracteatus TaxID=296719 RepID=A0A6V7PLA8_ANACO|nr:unnamed protein product [Ananas comosus var. bracteatus]